VSILRSLIERVTPAAGYTGHAPSASFLATLLTVAALLTVAVLLIVAVLRVVRPRLDGYR